MLDKLHNPRLIINGLQKKKKAVYPRKNLIINIVKSTVRKHHGRCLGCQCFVTVRKSAIMEEYSGERSLCVLVNWQNDKQIFSVLLTSRETGW